MIITIQTINDSRTTDFQRASTVQLLASRDLSTTHAIPRLYTLENNWIGAVERFHYIYINMKQSNNDELADMFN